MKTVSLSDLERIQKNSGFVRRKKAEKKEPVEPVAKPQPNVDLPKVLSEAIASSSDKNISAAKITGSAVEQGFAALLKHVQERKKRKFKMDVKRDSKGFIASIEVVEL